MTTTASAIYENGILRPLSPLPLAEGARVEVTVVDAPAPQVPTGRSAMQFFEEIAALPMESDKGPFSGKDHDRVLYGDPHA